SLLPPKRSCDGRNRPLESSLAQSILFIIASAFSINTRNFNHLIGIIVKFYLFNFPLQACLTTNEMFQRNSQTRDTRLVMLEQHALLLPTDHTHPRIRSACGS